MSTISLRLPDSLHRSVRQLAHRDHVSINQMIALALSEKISSLLTEEYLGQRARKGNKKAFLAVLRHVPDVEPDPQDRL